MFPNMLISILLFYLTIYSIHFFKQVKIRLTLNQHNLFDLTCMDVLKTGNLLTVTDARSESTRLNSSQTCALPDLSEQGAGPLSASMPT